MDEFTQKPWNILSVLAMVLALLGCNSAKTAKANQGTNVGVAPQETPQISQPHQPVVEEIESGVFFQEVSTNGPSGPMRVWLYAPARNLAEPAGCVIVPPAGSNLISGMRMSEGDRPEHVPYAKAGYVVVSFDIDGPISQSFSDVEAFLAIETFRESEAGIASAKKALETALETFPTIDRKQIYAAGHSSAATLALLFAAKDERINAVAAYAPVTDLVSWFPEQARQGLEQALPGFGDFLMTNSPLNHAVTLAKKPVFLFHASDDETAKPTESERLFSAMTNRHESSKKVLVESGGHYNSMIQDGVPQAIEWFSGLKETRPN